MSSFTLVPSLRRMLIEANSETPQQLDNSWRQGHETFTPLVAPVEQMFVTRALDAENMRWPPNQKKAAERESR